MKDNADNSQGGKKYELTQAYKSYAEYAFPNDETCHPRCKNAADSVIYTPTNDECKSPNWKCVLQKCNAFTSISLPGGERDSPKQSPRITFNTYMTQFTCSHHVTLIREKITTYLDAKGTSKNTCFLCEQFIQAKTPYFTRRGMYDISEPFSIQRKLGDFQKDFYIQQIEKLAYHRSY